MSVVNCKLFRIVIDREDALKVLRTAVLFGEIEPTDPLLPLDLSRVEAHKQKFLERRDKYQVLLDSLEVTPITRKDEKVFGEKEVQDILESLVELDDLYNKGFEIYTKLKGSIDLNEQLTNDLISLEKIKSIEVEIFGGQDLIKSAIGITPNEQVDIIKNELETIEYVGFDELSKDAENTTFVIAVPSDKAEFIKNLAERFNVNFIENNFKVKGKSPKSIFENTKQKLGELSSITNGLQEKKKNFIENHIQKFEYALDIINLELEVIGFAKYFSYYAGSAETEELSSKYVELLKEGNLVQLEGWIDPTQVDQLRNRLNKISKNILIVDMGGEYSVQARTKISNNVFIRPFEMITRLMGIPAFHEIDPSPFISIFFILFFGFALGDAGYGILMLLVSAYFIVIRKGLSKAMGDMMLLVTYLGISTIFFGAITGSWFGLSFDDLPVILQQLKVFDMQNEIITVLIATFVVGFIQQILGLLLSMATYIKNKEYSTAIFDPGTWLLLLGVFVLVVGGPLFLEDPTFIQQNTGPIILLTLLIFGFGQGYKTKNLLLRPLMGLTSLFNITGFLSNTLSYGRLAALGLATGVIASTINLLADLAGGGRETVFGTIIFIIVFIIGHLFNLVLNLLGTFINVIRLQLVEFFPRFFNAKGTELNPMQFEAKFIRFDNELNLKDISFNY